MKAKQLPLNIYKGKRGGRRPGAGRKRIKSPGVAHRTREKVSARTPLHINFKFRTNIKNKQSLKLLKRAIMNARTHGLKITHFSLQSNHVHLIVEAVHNSVLTKGLRSLTVTFAKGLKKGRVQVERYHLHVLKTIRETKNAIMYVVFNKQKHEKGTYSIIDEYTSLLYQANALQLIAKFAKRARMTLKISKADIWRIDEMSSFLLKKANYELIHNETTGLSSTSWQPRLQESKQ